MSSAHLQPVAVKFILGFSVHWLSLSLPAFLSSFPLHFVCKCVQVRVPVYFVCKCVQVPVLVYFVCKCVQVRVPVEAREQHPRAPRTLFLGTGL